MTTPHMSPLALDNLFFNRRARRAVWRIGTSEKARRVSAILQYLALAKAHDSRLHSYILRIGDDLP